MLAPEMSRLQPGLATLAPLLGRGGVDDQSRGAARLGWPRQARSNDEGLRTAASATPSKLTPVLGERPDSGPRGHFRAPVRGRSKEPDGELAGEHRERARALVTEADRRSKFIVLQAVPCETGELVRNGLAAILEPLHEAEPTETVDTGKEFAGHRKAVPPLEGEDWFPRPNRSWERGLNEHANGLARQYFRKSGS